MQTMKSTKTMPPILYGTAWKKDQTAKYVLEALEAGFRGIDTACQPKHYNEPLVGNAVERSGIAREQLYIQTKFTPLTGQDPDNIPYDKDALLYQQVEQSFAASQKNLKTDYVDALILHSPLASFDSLMQVWNAMQMIYSSGGAKALGISNCYDLSTLQRFYDEAQIKPSIVQNRFYAQSGYDRELRAWCLEHGITYQSFWSLTANPHILESSTVMALATKYGVSAAQIFFAYLMSQGITPLSGTTSLQHMRDDLEAAQITLEAEEIEKVSALLYG